MTTYQLFVQALAVIALGIFALSFHAKSRRGILLGQLISLWVLTVHFTLLHAWTGTALTLLNSLVTIALLFKKRRDDTDRRYILYVGLLLFLIAAAATWQGTFSVFALLGTLSITFAKWQTIPQRIRTFAIAASIFWIVYDAQVGSYGGIIAESAIIVSIIVSILIKKQGTGGGSI